MKQHNLRPEFDATIVPDPVLSPLLDRLAILESANYRLRSNLSERSFNVEVENAALSEKLARAKEEIAHHQSVLENLCGELLAAVQARDRAQAAVDESLKVRSEAVSQRNSLRLALDDALKASADTEASGAQMRRMLEEDLRAAQAAAEESFKVHAEMTSERDTLRLALDDALKARADAEASGAQIRRTLEEDLRAAQAAAEERFKIHEDMTSERDTLRLALDDALKARADAEARGAQTGRTLEEFIHSAQTAAEESFKVRAETSSERDSLRLALDNALKARVDAEVRDAQTRRTLEEDLRAAQAAVEQSYKVRGETASECDSLRLALDDVLKASVDDALREETTVEYPSIEYALEPGWARLLRLVKPPLQAAYGHLRRLSVGPMSAGQRAILRLTGSSLSQAADSLATIELALAEGPATAEAAPVLPVLESALAPWEAVFRRRTISLARDFSRMLPDSPHDPEQLRLALHHVLRNAVEALPRGATLRVYARASTTGAVEFEFRDDGPGYPPAWLERRFEPFVSPRQGHSGLGLAAVRRALLRWGGDASASNAATGRGACLTLTFATAPPRPATKS